MTVLAYIPQTVCAALLIGAALLALAALVERGAERPTGDVHLTRHTPLPYSLVGAAVDGRTDLTVTRQVTQ